MARQRNGAEPHRAVRRGLLSVRVADGDAQRVVTPVGELDASTVDRLEEELEKAMADGARRVVLDLNELTFMDSSGLRLVLQAHARSRTSPDRFSIVRGSPRVQRVFQLTNLESRLPFVD